MSLGDWYEPKDQLTIVREKRVAGATGRDHTHQEESHNWKVFKWAKGFVHYLNSLFPLFMF